MSYTYLLHPALYVVADPSRPLCVKNGSTDRLLAARVAECGWRSGGRDPRGHVSGEGDLMLKVVLRVNRKTHLIIPPQLSSQLSTLLSRRYTYSSGRSNSHGSSEISTASLRLFLSGFMHLCDITGKRRMVT